MGKSEDMSLTFEGIKEYEWTLSTLMGGSAELITENISGILDCFIIETSKSITIKISFAENPEIVLYEERNFMKTEYLPLRIESRNPEGGIFNFAPVPWNLNNRLKLEITGNINTETKFIMRLK